MKRNRFADEQIVAELRDAEATMVIEAARKHGVAEQTMYRWRPFLFTLARGRFWPTPVHRIATNHA